MIYLDNAATSWPKPPAVLRAMGRFLEETGGNPGRSGHRLSLAAARVIYGAREAAAELFGVADPLRVLFTANATEALNLALQGLLHPGEHVIVSSIEHNSVMRPLRALEKKGVRVSVARCRPDTSLDLAELERALTPATRLVALTHASNVTGALLPVAAAARLAHRHGALVLVDAAQTAGCIPFTVAGLGADLLVFSGHKGLQGPPGTGGLVLGADFDVARLDPLVRGGTGSRSEYEEQPAALPDRYESGTPNGPGLAGLGAGIRWVLARGVQALREKELALARLLRQGLAEVEGVQLYGPVEPEQSLAIVSFTVRGLGASEVGQRLDEEFGVLGRVGLHCAPAAHRTLGTFPGGTVRLAPGVFTTRKQIQAAVAAVSKIAKRWRHEMERMKDEG